MSELVPGSECANALSIYLKMTVITVSVYGVTGPSVLDVFNTLLRHLRTSVNSQTVARQQSVVKFVVGDQSDSSQTDTKLDVQATDVDVVERQFQNAVVNAIGRTLQHTATTSTATTTITILWALYRTTSVSRHPQLATGGFRCSKVLLPACPC